MKEINGTNYLLALQGGIKNLDNHKKILNDLNVFPVPDGDTGTNMVMTLRYGMETVRNMTDEPVSKIAASFASSAVYGARGNSGVIVSQFFKGISEALSDKECVDAPALSQAFDKGRDVAYKSVLKPVEGTMLTVIKDASHAVSAALPLDSVVDAVKIFLEEARLSLARTPLLLPILKKAGVVDSGGSGIVFFFEGVYKQLIGEEIEAPHEHQQTEIIDLSRFNTSTKFNYGYCTEGLIQLCQPPEKFNLSDFSAELGRIGKSVVATLEGDKVKIHVHTKDLGALMRLCQSKGEFLTIKIENMTVQNMQLQPKPREPQKFLVSELDGECDFGVVAATTTETVQKMFADMGADVVILSDIAPSSQDFMDAFALVKKRDIVVFPNSSNSILSSMQAAGFYKDARVAVLNSRSVSDCYAALSTMTFTSTFAEALSNAKDSISELYGVGIYHATKDTRFGDKEIKKNHFFSLADNSIISVAKSLEEVTLETVKSACGSSEYSLLNIFCGQDMSYEYIEHLKSKIEGLGYDFEIASIHTDEVGYSLLLSFS